MDYLDWNVPNVRFLLFFIILLISCFFHVDLVTLHKAFGSRIDRRQRWLLWELILGLIGRKRISVLGRVEGTVLGRVKGTVLGRVKCTVIFAKARAYK